MKVCYVSCYRDGTGYAKSAIEQILALDSVGVDVVPRSCKMTNTDGEVPDRISELEKKDLDNVDTVIQYNLPSEFAYKGGVRNIGTFAYETSGFPNTRWRDHLELMDGVFVLCNHQKEVILNHCGDYLFNKTRVIPHPVDTDKFTKFYDIMDFGIPKNTVKFYTVSEFSRRKNIPALLAAYYSEFSSDDNVILIIKAHDSNRNFGRGRSIAKSIIDDLKSSLNRFADPSRYPPVILLSQYMTDSQINSLHKSADVFVSASHGEAWCLPAVDALGFGNYVVAPNHSAFKDYIEHEIHGFLVDGVRSTVIGVNDSVPGLYTASEQWFNINVSSLSYIMRNAYNDIAKINDPEEKTQRFQYIRDKYSYNRTGNEIKKIIESINAS